MVGSMGSGDRGTERGEHRARGVAPAGVQPLGWPALPQEGHLRVGPGRAAGPAGGAAERARRGAGRP
eukprot:10084792-Alexandrium_andersonii.AAC.1